MKKKKRRNCKIKDVSKKEEIKRKSVLEQINFNAAGVDIGDRGYGDSSRGSC